MTTTAKNPKLSPEDAKLTLILREAFAGRKPIEAGLINPHVSAHLDRVLVAVKQDETPAPALLRAAILKIDCAMFLMKHSQGKRYTKDMLAWVNNSTAELKREFESANIPWPQGGVRDQFSNQLGVSIELMWSTQQYCDLVADYVVALLPSPDAQAAVATYVSWLRSGGKGLLQF